MPNPQNVKPYEFKPGQSGNPSGRPKGSGRDIQALDKLIEQLDAEPGIAKTWLKEALGQAETVVETVHPDGTITRKITRKAIPPNFAFFKMLIEYRNGKVPEDLNVTERRLVVDRRDRTERPPGEPAPDAGGGEE